MLGWVRKWLRRRGDEVAPVESSQVAGPSPEAAAAIIRAQEAVARAAAREPLVAEVTQSLQHLRQRNRFGEMIAESFRRTQP